MEVFAAEVRLWKRTGELRWFPHGLSMLTGRQEKSLQEEWRCRNTGEVEWRDIRFATRDEIAEHTQRRSR